LRKLIIEERRVEGYGELLSPLYKKWDIARGLTISHERLL
jgi:hypothetical protein